MAEPVIETTEILRVDAAGSMPQIALPVHAWSPASPCATLVLVHALSGCGQDFAALARRLAADGFRCLAPDMPGHGQAPPLPPRIGADSVVTRCLFRVAALAGPGPCLFLGSSWGGHVLLPVLLTGLLRVDGAVFNDIVLEGHPDLDDLPRRLGGKARARWRRFDDLRAAALSEAEGPYCQTDLRRVPVEVLDAWLRARHHVVGGHWQERFDPGSIRALDMHRNPETVARTPARMVARLRCPVVMVYGRESPFAGTRTLRALLELRGNVTELVLDGGHAPKLMTADQIEAVADRLRAMRDAA